MNSPRNLSLGIALGLFSAIAAPSAHAVSIVLGLGSPQYGVGGAFTVTATADSDSQTFVNKIKSNYADEAKSFGGFETFCIQFNEHFSPGTAYPVAISPNAISADGSTNAVSVGAGLLYSLYATGQLDNRVAGFDYANAVMIGDLQNMFWYLEGQIPRSPGDPPNIFDALLNEQFVTFAAAQGDNYGSVTAASYGVAALNMGGAGPPTWPNQDQLVYLGVPDGGETLLLLGVAMGGLALLKRRFA